MQRRRRRHAVRRIGALGGVLLLFVLFTSCEPDPYQGRSDGPRIAVIGDSLLEQMHEDYTSALVARGWNASVTPKGGYTTRDHWDTEERVMANDPDVVVIALGTNDVREINAGLQTYDGIRESVRHSIDITRGARCLVWAGINEVSGLYGPGLGNLAEFGWVVNVIIQQELASSGRAPGTTFYADWAAASRNHLDYFIAPGDVHHSVIGQHAFATTIDTAIARCPMPAPFGWLDSVVGGAGAVTVSGWAIDPFVTGPIDVHVYVDRFGYAVRADGYRPDVDAVHHRGTSHGFDASIPATPGVHRVCAYAIAQDQPGRPNVLLGCRTVTVGTAPTTTSTSSSTTSSSTTSTSISSSTSTSSSTSSSTTSSSTTSTSLAPATSPSMSGR